LVTVFNEICQGFIEDWLKIINPKFIRDRLGYFMTAKEIGKLGKLEEVKLSNFFGGHEVQVVT
jgi:hypothetical protein